MSGLLAKDMELLKINMKTYLAVFLIGFMYPDRTEEWKHLLCVLFDFCKYWCLCRNDFL